MVDSLGLILGIVVTGAEIADRAGALEVLPRVLWVHPRLEQLWADARYTGGTLAEDLRADAVHSDLRLNTVKCPIPHPIHTYHASQALQITFYKLY